MAWLGAITSYGKAVIRYGLAITVTYRGAISSYGGAITS